LHINRKENYIYINLEKKIIQENINFRNIFLYSCIVFELYDILKFKIYVEKLLVYKSYFYFYFFFILYIYFKSIKTNYNTLIHYEHYNNSQ